MYSGSLSPLVFIMGTISGSDKCMFYNVFNFVNLLKILISRCAQAVQIKKVQHPSVIPLGSVLKSLLMQEIPLALPGLLLGARTSESGTLWRIFLHAGSKFTFLLLIPADITLCYCKLSTSKKCWITKLGLEKLLFMSKKWLWHPFKLLSYVSCIPYFVLLSHIWAHRKIESDDYLILTVPLEEGSLADENIIFSYLKIAEVFVVLATSSEQDTFVTLRWMFAQFC